MCISRFKPIGVHYLSLNNLQKTFADKVIYAINAGGESHVDTYGIRYQHDPLRSVGTASDYGKQLLIGKIYLRYI